MIGRYFRRHFAERLFRMHPKQYLLCSSISRADIELKSTTRKSLLLTDVPMAAPCAPMPVAHFRAYR